MKVRMLAMIFLFLLLINNISYAVTWNEITRFTPYWGTAPGVVRETQTANFTCDHSEWRIVWSYTPLTNILDPENVYFDIFIYRTNETNYILDLNQQGSTITNGTMYINNRPGEFYLKLLVYNVLNATAAIEQDVESAPEFSLMFQLFLLTGATLVAVILTRRGMRITDSKRKSLQSI